MMILLIIFCCLVGILAYDRGIFENAKVSNFRRVTGPQYPLKRVCFFDCHTTGVDRQNDRIVEFTIIRFKYDRKSKTYVKDSLSKKVHPKVPSSKEAEKIHGFSYEELAPYPDFSTYVPEIIKFVGGRKVIAHWASFDRDMIDAEFSRADEVRKFRIEDSLDIITLNDADFDKTKFTDVLQYYGIELKSSGSQGNAEALVELFEKLGII